MAVWSSQTWAESGTWVETNTGQTAQVQHASGTASVAISGVAATGQKQGALGAAAETIPGAVATGQRQSTVVAGSERITGAASSSQLQTADADVVETIGGTATSGEIQSVSGLGSMSNQSGVITAQRQSASGAAVIQYPASVQTKTPQSATAAGALQVDGDAVGGQVQSVEVDGALVFEVVGMTAQDGQGTFGVAVSASFAEAETGQSDASSVGVAELVIPGVGRTGTVNEQPKGYGKAPVQDSFRDMLERLLRYPHLAVFAKEPDAEAALSFTDNGVLWQIEDGVLAIQPEGEVPRYFSVDDVTVGELAAKIGNTGVGVHVHAAFSRLSGGVLLDSSGSYRVSPILGFTSLLWMLLHGYAHELTEAAEQLRNALRQMVITQAEGEWLDVWGNLYGVPRMAEETDPHFAPRIPEEAFRIRVNAIAIEKAIFDQTGFDVIIKEPWSEVFRLDESVLSGDHRFYDGSYTGYHLIQPTADTEVDWSVVMPIIMRNKAAGVVVLEPLVRRVSHVEATDHSVVSGVTCTHVRGDRYTDRTLLDFSTMLDSSEGIIVNHYSRRRTEVLRSSHVVADDTGSYQVRSNYSRDYRSHYLAIYYRGQSWTVPGTWSQARNSWADLNATVQSSHTRS